MAGVSGDSATHDGVQAVLFDLDGTLVDSERESAEAMARVLAREGLTVTQQQRDFVVGHSWNEIYALLRADFGAALRLDLTAVIDRSAAERVHVIAEQGMTIMPGAVAAVERIGARWAKAIVTGSSRAEAGQALAALGLVAAFPVVLAAEDYAQGKPSPAGYLAAATRLGAAPARCVVLEDSAAGIAAGRAAGMTVIAIRAGNFAGHDQSGAHHIVDTLDAVTIELIERAAAERTL
jgi:HAD superfamily hydrolase (TIGR01509 family)